MSSRLSEQSHQFSQSEQDSNVNHPIGVIKYYLVPLQYIEDQIFDLLFYASILNVFQRFYNNK